MSNLSHRERMASAQIHYPKSLSEPYEVIGSEDVVVNNRVVKRSIKQVIDPKEMFKGVKVSDFYLENLIAVGALDSLKGGTVSDSTLNAADNAEAQLAKMVDAAENNLNNGGNE